MSRMCYFVRQVAQACGSECLKDKKQGSLGLRGLADRDCDGLAGWLAAYFMLSLRVFGTGAGARE